LVELLAAQRALNPRRLGRNVTAAGTLERRTDLADAQLRSACRIRRPAQQLQGIRGVQVAVSVRRDTPLRTTLRARNVRPGTGTGPNSGPNRDRDLAGV